jgi:hypothetical protein
LPRLEVERTAARNLGLLRIGVAFHELDRGAEGIADGQAEQRAARAVEYVPRRLRVGDC